MSNGLNAGNDLLCEIQTSVHSSTGFSIDNIEGLGIITDFVNRERELREQLDEAQKLLTKASKEIGNANGNHPFLRSVEDNMEQAKKKITFVRKELSKMQDENNKFELEYGNEYPGSVIACLVQFQALVKGLRSQVDMIGALRKKS